MKILVLDQYSSLGGGQQCLVDLLPAFRARGWNTQLLAPGWGPLHDEVLRNGGSAGSLQLDTYQSRNKSLAEILRFGWSLPGMVRQIRKATHSFRPDVVYVNGPRALPAAVVATGSPHLVFHAHSIPEQGSALRLTQVCSEVPRVTVIAASAFVLRSLFRGPGAARQVIYSGVADHTAERRKQAGTFRVGLIGRIAPEKGHLDLVRAARHIVSGVTKFEFHVFGAPLFSGDEYERQVRDQAIGLPIYFHGWTSSVRDALSGLDLVVVPSSLLDAAPRVILEALSARVPVVAYRAGGIPELIEPGVSGILTKRNAPDSLADEIVGLANDSARRNQLGEAGRRHWERSFTVERFRDEVCETLERSSKI